MVRIIFTYVVPFIAPLIGWYLWVRFVRKPAETNGRRKTPWHWLAVAGGLAVVAALLVTSPPDDLAGGARKRGLGPPRGEPGQTYEPARLEDGKVVPGRYQPKEGK